MPVFVGKRAAGGQEVEHGVFLFWGRDGRSGEPGGEKVTLSKGALLPLPRTPSPHPPKLFGWWGGGAEGVPLYVPLNSLINEI